MGVPAFYRWLSEKYPKIVLEMLEKRPMVIDGVEIPVNLTDPNPNNMEFDNLYVDMNGLIHPCSHPEDREAPTSEEEMYLNVMKYVDRLFAAVRPRKLLFLAIDGVAPRAKMNQQRARRFRAVQDAVERRRVLEEVREEMASLGLKVPPKKEGHEWDSNVITPGTEFMDKLSDYLWFYVLDRMNKNPAWRDIKVIISDASEPGEGEHKIMNFIRSERCQEGYDPNQRHVIHGLDADLIMLALATHEPHFTILREKVFFGKKDPKNSQKSDAQQYLEAEAKKEGAVVSCLHPEDEWVYAKPLQALHINLLREYLTGEFKCLQHGLPFPFDFERVIDDFVFMCFFVGNDFLPHLPSLDIRDGAIDFLIHSYKELLPSLGDYLTSPGGNVNLKQADILLGCVGDIEEEIFRKKKEMEDYEEKRRESFMKRNESNVKPNKSALEVVPKDIVPVKDETLESSNHTRKRQIVPASHASTRPSVSNTNESKMDNLLFNKQANQLAAKQLRDSFLGKRIKSESAATDSNESTDNQNTESATKYIKVEESVTAEESIDCVGPVDVKMEENLDENITNEVDEVTSEEDEEIDTVVQPIITAILPMVPDSSSSKDIKGTKEELQKRIKDKERQLIDGYKQTIKDNVRLHEQGWKERYYEDKYKKEDIEKGGGLERMCQTYVQGLCWVLKYYYEGCPSWNWYYPFHYAPFACDLRNIDTYEISFELSKPFRPIEQLLSVLPSESANALPEECRWLMTSPSSSIVDIYVSDAPLDPNGKHLPWLWVLLLPFVDESRISAAFNECKSTLSIESRRRNAFGQSIILLHKNHPISADFSKSREYKIGVETDSEVIAALKLLDDTIDTDRMHNGDSDNSTINVFFNPSEGQGVCGYIGDAAPKRYADVDRMIIAPQKPTGVFQNIERNHIMSFNFRLPENVVPSSALLPGVIIPPPTLTDYETQPRRPPRFGKSAFNIMNIANEKRRSNQQGYEPYYQPQYAPQNPSLNSNVWANTPHMSNGRGMSQGYNTQHRPSNSQMYPSQSNSNQGPSWGNQRPTDQIQNKNQPFSFHSNQNIATFTVPSIQSLVPATSMEAMRNQLAQVLHNRQQTAPSGIGNYQSPQYQQQNFQRQQNQQGRGRGRQQRY